MKSISLFISLCVSFLLSCSFEHVPTLPIIQYNPETSKLVFIQTDTAAHDTVVVRIDGVYEKTFRIKDTVTVSLNKIVEHIDQLKFAYLLASNDNTQQVSVHTSRSNDTIFIYSYKTISIPHINVANLVYGNCIGLCDINQRRNYKDKIRRWIFKNNVSPDSLLIENMNSLMKQFNYSGHKEYSKLPGDPPILKSIKGVQYKFDVDMSGKYFYLYVSQDGKDIRAFVEKKISEGLKDAHFSTKDAFICKQSGKKGPNCLFMIGIDENWKYTVIPLGIVFIDNEPPGIHAARGGITDIINWLFSHSSSSSNPWPNKIYLKNQNVLVNVPQPSVELTSEVFVYYGHFEGNDYFGYNIPFYIYFSGDVRTITIGAHKLDAKKIKSNECTRLQIKGLHTGDNSISISATDVRGNKSTSSLSISLVPVRNNQSYDDYDNLDSRISDIESRLDDLE